ncbi:MAG: ABC transporter substrate-binding protein [Hyphomicrobiaceae bacterium]|nr:ABC transporter substrate-binding protein [Hyphomicrobiaceae bacterium]
MPEPTDGGTTYTFKIRKGVKFHDGTSLTSKDILATFNKIIFPPKGIPSSRKAFFSMVKSISAPDDETVVFKLKAPSGSFLPSIAMPFNFVYSKKDLDTHGYRWHRKNINGTGAFKFVEYQPGAFVRGVRYDGYHLKGRPYLAGFRAIQAPKAAIRLQALRGDRAAIEFRGFPPKARDDMMNALGKKISVQEGDWNCSLFLTPNHKKKPFDDARVRRALTLALDRWAGSEYLRKIAIMKTVGGIVFPGHPLAIKPADLRKLAGFGDIKASRAEARRLLKEAGAEGLKFTLLNRNVDQPYKILGTWAIDQWRKIGLDVKQETVTTPVWYSKLRKTKDFDVSTDANCQSVVNPVADVAKFLGGQSNNYGNYKDPELQAIYNKLVVAPSVAEQAKLMRQFEKRAIDDQAHMMTSFWWYRIVLMRSYVKGWKTSPSHYLNQHLDNIWLEK